MGTAVKIIILIFTIGCQVFSQIDDSALVEEYSIGAFTGATRVVLGANRMLFVIDAAKNQLILFADGKNQTESIGGFGWSGSSFDNPTGVATDGVNIYVSDFGNHRIQRFDRNLNYIFSLTTRDTTNLSCRFGYPRDIAVSQFGDLFVLDGENLRVLKFSPSYFFERSFGDIDAGKGKLQNPVKLIATTSRIFVGELKRIVVFDYFGNFIGSIGDSIINDLSGFTLLPEGLIAVSTERLWWFSKDGSYRKTASIKSLIAGERVEKIQDVACNGKQLFVLSPHRIHIFNLN